ncbi:MAG: hypothetical protein ABFD79_02265 [Phycisphaerales bacterium]
MLEVYNDNNKLLIDGKYQNLQLLRKVQCSSANAYAIGYGGTFSYGHKISLGTNELVFAYSYSGSGSCSFYQETDRDFPDNDQTTYSIVIVPTDQKAMLDSLQCYVFGIPPSATTGAALGLEVFSGGGSLVFSSANKYLNVIAGEHLYTTNKSDLVKTYSLGDKKVAVGMGIAWRNDYNNNGILMAMERITINNTAKTVTIDTGDIRVAGSGYSNNNLWCNRISSYLLADVTNL